jgi:hypothetical protein
MAKKSSAAKGRAGNPLPAASQTDDGAHGVTRPTKLKPSSLLDTRVVYCGDNLEQLAKLPDACNSEFRTPPSAFAMTGSFYFHCDWHASQDEESRGIKHGCSA